LTAKPPVVPSSPLRLSPVLEHELYARSGASGWDVLFETFSARLNVCVAKRYQDDPPSARDVDAFARSLHLEDLALACACAAGHERAWEHFMRELRPSMYAAARQMTSPERARELADSLFADLFGLDDRGGQRRSLLDYYHGRARLTTWLRTVMAQRHVDSLRISARSVPLDDTEGTAAVVDPQPPASPRHSESVERAQRALDTAVAALEPRDRLRLRLYYGEGLKLAQIGRLLGEHEATASRKLDRVRRTIREGIERTLREEYGLRPEAVAECLEEAAGAPELDLSRALAADDG
jgi:RNA polymerase sigma-70 factor (ECF subfamily)